MFKNLKPKKSMCEKHGVSIYEIVCLFAKISKYVSDHINIPLEGCFSTLPSTVTPQVSQQ